MKPRRSALFSLLTMLTLAAVAQFVIVLLYPYVVTGYVSDLFSRNAGSNAFYHARRPTADEREVAMPSPDLIYSAGAYDVSQRPLHITAPTTGSYMSLSLYADNMDNFFVQNDLAVTGGKFDLVLIGSHTKASQQPGVRLVRAPSDTGVMVFRFFAGEGADAKRIEAVRRQIQSKPQQAP